VLAAVALQTGFARWVFSKYSPRQGEDVLGPTVLRNPPVNSPYQRWLERVRNEIPMFEGLVIQDIEHVALSPWPQMGEGITGLYLHFADYQMTDGRILEIPPGGQTASQRHLYEKGIYFLSGEGYTILQQEGKPLQRVNWSEGDLFSVPLNVLHQHYNTGSGPARMLMVTSFPLVLNVMNNEDFIDHDTYAFTDRYDAAPDYLQRVEDVNEIENAANFVEDVPTTGTRKFDQIGKGNETMHWLMAGNSMLNMHVMELPPKAHNKGHRHASDAFILLLSGTGYSVAWREGAYDDRVRVDWQAGTLFVPPTYWYHQHFNTSSTPARHLAINVPGIVRNLGLHFQDYLEVDTRSHGRVGKGT
jgi:uncharacterized RmlC-like cupin family protein